MPDSEASHNSHSTSHSRRTHRSGDSRRSGDSQRPKDPEIFREVVLNPDTGKAVQVYGRERKRDGPRSSGGSNYGDDQRSEYTAGSSANSDSTVRQRKSKGGKKSELPTIDEREAHVPDEYDGQLVKRDHVFDDVSRGGSRIASSHRAGSDANSRRTSTRGPRRPAPSEKEIGPDDSITSISVETYKSKGSKGRGSLFEYDMQKPKRHYLISNGGGSAIAPPRYPPSDGGQSGYDRPPPPRYPPSDGGQSGYDRPPPPPPQRDMDIYQPRPAKIVHSQQQTSFMSDGRGGKYYNSSSQYYESYMG